MTTHFKSSKSSANLAPTQRHSEIEEVSVPQNVYLSYIRQQIEDESACLELPLTIMLLLSFSLLAVLHLKQDTVFSVEQGIERDILENANFAFSHAFGHKDITDAHSIADFWSWVRLGFIPLVIQPTWSYSENYQEDAERLFNYTAGPSEKYSIHGADSRPLPIKGDYLRYHRIIGGLRFRQEVAPSSDAACKFPTSGDQETWAQWYGKPCMPASTDVVFMPDTPRAEVFGEPQRVEWMFTDLDPLGTMLAHVVDMEDGCSQMAAKNRSKCLCAWCQQQEPALPWLTEDTQRVEISMATYNPEYGLITLTGVNFFFNRGSFIHKRVELQSSWMDPLSFPLAELVPMLICDFVWLASLVYITASELREIVHTIRAGEGKWYRSLLNDYIAFWNIVDWVSILVALVVVIFFALLMSRTVELHRTFLSFIRAPREGGVGGRGAYTALVIEFYGALESVCEWEKLFRMFLCIYPMMVMLRLFKSFSAQPRLAMVTETMKEAYQDMLHFSLVFLGVSVCLCLNAVLLFGQDHEEFATFSRALHSCFRMMFGDWDWQPMEEVWRIMAMLWFWLFMLLLVFILLNMLLAIVMDNYMNVKKRSSSAITLGDQIQSMWRRRKQTLRKERVKLTDILQWFTEDADQAEEKVMESARLITPTFLMNNVRNIPMDQALRTLKNAEKQHRKATEDEFKLEDAVAPLDRISANTRLIRDGLYYAFDRAEYYDTGPEGEPQPEEEQEAEAPLGSGDNGKPSGDGDPLVTDGVLDFVTAEVQRLSSETASVLAQSVKRLDRRQTRIEHRQVDMASSVREMHAALLNLQSDASSLANRLQKICHDQAQAQSQVSTWRRGLANCKVMPSCMDLYTADAQEALLPNVHQSVLGRGSLTTA